MTTEDVFRLLSGRPTVERSRNLQDQFHYVYAIASEGTTSGYAWKFRGSFVLMGVVTTTDLPASFDEDPENGAFQGNPFAPAPA